MPDLTITDLKIRHRDRPTYVYPKYGRPYLSDTMASYHSRPRVYVHVAGDTVLADFACRFDRPHKVYRTFLPAILAAIGADGAKANWSQKAGCSCGCSPAFILKDVPASCFSGGPFDVFVTLGGDTSSALLDNGANLDRVAARLDGLAADPTIPTGLLG